MSWMRVTRRLLLFVALWAGAGSVVALPAHADQVQQCRLVAGRFVLSPGLTDVPSNQTITAHGRLSGCSSGGGSATFAATVAATPVTCATFATGLLPADVAFGWADHQSTIASLSFSSPPGSPNKVELLGRAISGAALGSRVEGGLRMSVEFPPVVANRAHAHVRHAHVQRARERRQLVPLVSKTNVCSVTSPITAIDVTNFEGFALGTPRARPAPKPAAHKSGPGSTKPATGPTAATTTSVASTTTTTTQPAVTIPPHTEPRRRVSPIKTKRLAIGGLGSPAPSGSSTFATPESLLGAGVAGGSVFGLGLLFFRRARRVAR
jgi:hypothetical protein